MLLHHSWQPTGEDQATVCNTWLICLSLRQHQKRLLQGASFGTSATDICLGKIPVESNQLSYNVTNYYMRASNPLHLPVYKFILNNEQEKYLSFLYHPWISKQIPSRVSVHPFRRTLILHVCLRHSWKDKQQKSLLYGDREMGISTWDTKSGT